MRSTKGWAITVNEKGLFKQSLQYFDYLPCSEALKVPVPSIQNI
jgi:hypothetical protein